MHPALDLEAKVDAILARADDETLPAVPASLYLDLAESIVRQAARLQAPDGHVDDPMAPRRRDVTATGRYAGAVAHLLRAGRCLDLLNPRWLPSTGAAIRVVAAYREGSLARFRFLPQGCPCPLPGFGGTAPATGWSAGRATWRPTIRSSSTTAGTTGSSITPPPRWCGSAVSDRHDYVEQALASQLEQWTPFGMYATRTIR